jgi:iron complex transport system substrate-binding protein
MTTIFRCSMMLLKPGEKHIRLLCLLLAFCLLPTPVAAELRVTDDAGRAVVLATPARRIVSLAPYITELLFAAGAGEYVIGASGYSDYPPAARDIPRIGSGMALDLERIVALQPDLVVAWESGNPADQVARLHALGLPVFLSEPHTLEDVGTSLLKLGQLTATGEPARLAVTAYYEQLASLRLSNTGKQPVRVFYQLWDQPLMTVNDTHIISDVIQLCGGVNVFAGMGLLVPQVGIEAVLERNPAVIIAAADGGNAPNLLDTWQRWPGLRAVDGGHLYTIPGDLLVRHSPRILAGVTQLCEILDRVRDDDL